jgi:hypothetical protein
VLRIIVTETTIFLIVNIAVPFLIDQCVLFVAWCGG